MHRTAGARAGARVHALTRVDLSNGDLAGLCAAGSVLQRKLGQPAVIRHQDPVGPCITKVWMRRRWPSSDWVYPYHRRFCRNAAELRRRGIEAPCVVRFGDVLDTDRRYVTYHHIPGESLRAIVTRHEAVELEDIAHFVATLHTNGVYFRSLHLGNVLRTSARCYALVDVTDVSFRPGPLSPNRRARNLSFLFSHAGDAAALEPREVFMEAYREACGADARTADAFERALARTSRRRAR